MKPIRTLTISLLLLFRFACQPGGPAETDPSPTINPSLTAGDSALDENLIPGTKSLQQALSEAGADVALEGSIDQSFFSAPGQIISVNSEPVQVFEYSDPALTDADPAQHKETAHYSKWRDTGGPAATRGMLRKWLSRAPASSTITSFLETRVEDELIRHRR